MVNFSPRHIGSLILKNSSFKQTILKNAFWLALSEAVEKGALFFLTVWLVRYFGPVGYGKWAFAMGFAGIFATVGDFGLVNYAVRELSREREEASRYIDNIIAVKTVLGLISLSLLVLASRSLGKSPEVLRLLYILGFYAMISTFSGFFHSVFRANQQMQYETVCRAFHALLVVIFVVAAIKARGSLFCISAAYVMSAIVSLLFSIAFVRAYFVRFFFRIDRVFFTKILKEVWPIGLAFVFIAGYYNVDTVMLSLMKTDADVGWYNSAYRVLLFLLVLPSLLQAAFYPGMAGSFAVSKEKLCYVYDRFLKNTLVIASPICVFIMLNAENVTVGVYGQEFLPAARVLRILMLSFLFASVGGVLANVLLSCNRQKMLMVVTGASFAGNILLNYLWIPKFSYIGASHATNLTRVFVIVAELCLIARLGYTLSLKEYLTKGVKIVFALFIMVGASWWLADVSIVGSAFLALAVYPCALHVVRGGRS
ncbi:MAG: flippase [Candidatus Omnitrophica bacterium]|nr:flippase [Candidatus Omnitrophota bacterium]MDD4013802.1 flippase [Candidatus Omnitrophota bacterium]